MTATAGFLSTVKVGATVVNNFKSQDLAVKIAALDTTSFSASTPGTESFIGGLLSGQFKCSGQYDKADTGQGTMETNFFARTLTTFTFSPNGTNTWTVTCLITDYQVKSEVKGLVQVDFTLQLSGGVALA